MKRIIAWALTLCLAVGMFSGCAGEQQYNVTYLDLFDTVTTVVGIAGSQEAFQEKAQTVYDLLLEYHQLFDIYKEYADVNNLKTVNDNAGIAPVKVDGRIITLLLDCQRYYNLTGGKVNVAMGSVLKLWHDARTAGINDPDNAALPDAQALEEAAAHTDFGNVIIDKENSTVYLSDPDMRLDVGAVAKGWAVQQVAWEAPQGLLISVGGNVCATGPKDSAGTPWVVGIQDPDGGSEYLHTLSIAGGSVVTSGDYQRAYTVDGKMYHHIIDPDTRMPASYWRSVSILCEDSGMADVLSTALFLLPREEGQKLLTDWGAEAMWVDAQGNCFYSPGFEAYIRA